MRIDEITDTLLVNREEGLSININGEQPKDGYMVGGEVPNFVISCPFELSALDGVDAFLSLHEALLSRPEYFAGVWTDSDTGLVYVDISRKVDDLYTALAIAESRGELAVWDVAENKEIRTEVNQGVVTSAV